MLVLTRKRDESIIINNDITIVVVEIRGDKVRLGIEAPKEVPVHRREVHEAILRQALEQEAKFLCRKWRTDRSTVFVITTSGGKIREINQILLRTCNSIARRKVVLLQAPVGYGGSLIPIMQRYDF